MTIEAQKVKELWHAYRAAVLRKGLSEVRAAVNDVDFAHHQIVVQDGKGQKDRVTPLPQRCGIFTTLFALVGAAGSTVQCAEPTQRGWVSASIGSCRRNDHGTSGSSGSISRLSISTARSVFTPRSLVGR